MTCDQHSLAVHVDRALHPSEERTDEPFYSHEDIVGSLPISSHRERFVASVKQHKVTLVIGETGSGKSTLLPQFLLEDSQLLGVCVAEPRRMAAVNLATYICSQRKCRLGEDEVGYAIRYEQKANDKTKLVFVTVGLLLRQFLFDPLLERYQIVILDEIHERSVDMDVATALLKKVIQRRSDFRVVLASATPDVHQITRFFKDDLAIVHIAGRQHPVSIFHVKHPVPDYVKASYQSIVDIHEENKYEHGAILCFLPGQEEISEVMSMLNEYQQSSKQGKSILPIPLHASLPHHKKVQAFRKSARHVRKVILATSIAETSLTIPDVVFVVDSGFTRNRFKSIAGQFVDTLLTVVVSQQEADQRAGRAGRLRPGYCYRLYPHDIELQAMPEPEINRIDLTSYLLRILSLGVENIARFDLPSQPNVQSILSALDAMIAMRLVDPDTGRLTNPDGRRAAELPIDCKYSVTLFRAEEMGCLDELLDIVSAFQVRDIFTSRAKKLKLFGAKEGDVITLLNAVRGYRNCSNGKDALGFCSRNGLNYDSLCRAQQIRRQLERTFRVQPSQMSDSFCSTDIILKCLISGLFHNAVMLCEKQTGPNPGGEYQSILNDPQAAGSKTRLHIHKHSVFYAMEPLPQLLIYHTLSENNIMFELSVVRDLSWFREIMPHYFCYGTERQLDMINKTDSP